MFMLYPMVRPFVAAAPPPSGELIADSWIYVSPTGNNANGRQSSLAAAMAAPMQTPQNAADKAVAGTAVIFKNGTYNAPNSTTRVLNLGTAHQGTATKPIFFVAENRRQAIFNGPSNESCIFVGQAKWIEIHGLELVGNYVTGPDDNNVVKVIGNSNPNPAEIQLTLADCELAGTAGDGFKSGTMIGLRIKGCEFTGTWRDGNEAIDCVTTHECEIEYNRTTTGMISIKGGGIETLVRFNDITSPREAMRDGELGGSRFNRDVPTNPAFPWAEAKASEWSYNRVKTTSTATEPGWARGAADGNYHHNFFESATGTQRPIQISRAQCAYYENVDFSDVPLAERPFVDDSAPDDTSTTPDTRNYYSWCRNLTLADNARKTGMTAGALVDPDQGTGLSQTGWTTADSFAEAFPGVTIGPAGWDTTAIRGKVGLP